MGIIPTNEMYRRRLKELKNEFIDELNEYSHEIAASATAEGEGARGGGSASTGGGGSRRRTRRSRRF